MQKVTDSKRLRYSYFVGFGFVLIWLGFWEYCFLTAPRFPVEASDRVYSINFHGTLLYLNKIEYAAFYAIPGIFLMLGIVSAIYIRFRNRK